MGPAVHHIVKPGRSDEPTNFLLLCMRCHALSDDGMTYRDAGGEISPRLTLGVALAIKREADPGEFDAARLAALFGRALPAEAQLPEYDARLREDWRRG